MELPQKYVFKNMKKLITLPLVLGSYLPLLSQNVIGDGNFSFSYNHRSNSAFRSMATVSSSTASPAPSFLGCQHYLLRPVRPLAIDIEDGTYFLRVGSQVKRIVISR